MSDITLYKVKFTKVDHKVLQSEMYKGSVPIDIYDKLHPHTGVWSIGIPEDRSIMAMSTDDKLLESFCQGVSFAFKTGNWDNFFTIPSNGDKNDIS
jgi:hypothetical protein